MSDLPIGITAKVSNVFMVSFSIIRLLAVDVVTVLLAWLAFG